MRKLLLNILRLYFRKFPIRKGKIPVMILLDKFGLTKHYFTISTFDKNIKMNLNLDDWIQKQVFYFGRYEIEKKETLFWQYLVRDKDYVFDIGANIGYYTLQAAARVGVDGKVFAFEPVLATFNKLRENIKLNNFLNIITENLAVSNREGEIELFLADEKSTGSSSISMHVNFSGVKEKVKTIKIDDYVKNKNIYKLDLVKIDVEGCEPMVIEGMLETLNRFKPIILIEVLDERLTTINSSKEMLFKIFNDINYFAFDIISENSVKAIDIPKEGILVVFKHKDSLFFDNINII